WIQESCQRFLRYADQAGSLESSCGRPTGERAQLAWAPLRHGCGTCSQRYLVILLEASCPYFVPSPWRPSVGSERHQNQEVERPAARGDVVRLPTSGVLK